MTKVLFKFTVICFYQYEMKNMQVLSYQDLISDVLFC